MKTADISVELLDYMGSDLSVVNAARVSFDKESEWQENLYDAVEYVQCVQKSLPEKDTKLLKYLAKHNHWTPFAHCFLSFRVKVPMFVAMQLDKHVVGLVTNSVSRRYVSSEPEFYFPKTWRKAAENVKQGSSDEEVKLRMGFHINGVCSLVEECLLTYNSMLSQGVCAEQSRMVLPMNTMTERIWSGSLAAFIRVCKLRLDSHSQKETQEVARLLASLIEPLFPVSYRALMEV